jgi:hypothetical protein
MKYITRDLYLSTQSATAESHRRWNEACAAYRAELAAIKSRLPPAMRSFSDITLHDGIVKSAVRPRPDCVELQVDASNNPWGPRGQFRVVFSGVPQVEGLSEIVGDEWLYEEVHLDPDGGFEYCILLLRSEFRVVADDVTFETVSRAEEAVVFRVQ